MISTASTAKFEHLKNYNNLKYEANNENQKIEIENEKILNIFNPIKEISQISISNQNILNYLNSGKDYQISLSKNIEINKFLLHSLISNASIYGFNDIETNNFYLRLINYINYLERNLSNLSQI